MQTKWALTLAADPFYSPNLSRTTEDYSLRRKGGRAKAGTGEATAQGV